MKCCLEILGQPIKIPNLRNNIAIRELARARPRSIAGVKLKVLKTIPSFVSGLKCPKPYSTPNSQSITKFDIIYNSISLHQA